MTNGVEFTIHLQFTVRLPDPTPPSPELDTRRRLLLVSKDRELVARFRANFALDYYPNRMRFQSAENCIDAGAVMSDFRPHLVLVDSRIGLDDSVSILHFCPGLRARGAVLVGADERSFFSEYQSFQRLESGANHRPLIDSVGQSLLN